MRVRRIQSADTWPIRHLVLRPNQTPEDCKYPLDDAAESFHLGAFQGERLIAIASFYFESHREIPGAPQFRLRGMASLPEFRGLGAGSALVRQAETIVAERHVRVWWCNARTTVSGYYEKLGLRTQGEVFDLPPLGPHVLMYKVLRIPSNR